MNTNRLYFSTLNKFDHQDEGISEVCTANINPKGRQLRKRFAVGQLIITLSVLTVMVLLHADPVWRLLLFFMFSVATTSYFQALEKT